MVNGCPELVCEAEGHAKLVVGFCEQPAVRWQVFELQGQAVLEVVKGLTIITFKKTGQVSNKATRQVMLV